MLLLPPLTAQAASGEGTLAQMVEQRTENPCVPGSIPGGTTRALQLLTLSTSTGFLISPIISAFIIPPSMPLIIYRILSFPFTAYKIGGYPV